MDVKEIKDNLDTFSAVVSEGWTMQLFALACDLLSEVERLEKENKKLQDSLYKNSRISDYTLLEERCAKLEKENAALREAIKAMEETEDEFQERINGVSRNGDE